MISSQSGLSQSARLLQDARATTPGYPQWLLIRGAVTKRPIDLAVWATIAGFFCGILALACSIDLARFVLHSLRCNDLSNTLRQHHQTSARRRSSIVAPNSQSGLRHRADSGGNRVRSDSERTEKFDGALEAVESHPVEPRARTALLPPIMVCYGPAWNLLLEPNPLTVQGCR